MTEHLDADEFAGRSFYLLLHDISMDGCHLFQVQFPRQYHHVGILAVKLQRLGVGNIELGGEVHLHPDAPGVHQHRHVGRDDGRQVGLLRGIHHLPHQLHVFVVDDGVHGEVAFYTLVPADLRDGMQVVNREVIGRLGTHVQTLDTEVNGVRPPLDRRRERLVGPGGCHYLVILHSVHYTALIYKREGTKKTDESCQEPVRSLIVTSFNKSKVSLHKTRLFSPWHNSNTSAYHLFITQWKFSLFQ